MKNCKVIIFLLLALSVVVALSACSGQGENAVKSEPEATVVGTWKLLGVYNEVGKCVIAAEDMDSDLTLVMKNDDTYTLTGTWMGRGVNDSDSYGYLSDRESASIAGRKSYSSDKGGGYLGFLVMKPFHLEGDTLTVSMFGMQLIFVR